MNLRESYRHIRALFSRKGNQEFLPKEAVWGYLSRIKLSEEEKRILESSFRTRARIDGEILSLQFRISVSSLTEIEQSRVETLRNSLHSKLSKSLPDKTIVVILKVSDCCGKGCYGCTKYCL